MPDSHLKNRSSRRKRTVLVVEDELINREILGFLIQDEFEALFAENGAQAMEIIEAGYATLSLILLDLNLPDMKGQEILRRVKEDVRTALLPVIVMTADSDAEVECLHMGATDFIPKPYPKKDVILARMQRTIELFEDRDTIRSTERDQLTGLYNREFFYRYAEQYDAYHPDVETDAVLVNINHFHIVNERYGRAYGDELLKKIATKLLEVFADDGIVCRREADTFLAYCPHRTEYEELLESIKASVDAGSQMRLRMGVYFNVDRSIEVERRFDRAKLAARLPNG